MTAAALWLALVAGCAPKAALPVPAPAPLVPADLPEPAAVLEAGAESVDPSTRGRALAHLVRADPAPGAATWAQRGLWDPEPWVERQVVEALTGRLEEPETVEVLTGYVARDNTDPYVRAGAALALLGHGPAEVGQTMSAAWRAAGAPWQRAPLALGALAWGDAEAAEPLAAALSRGELAMEADFLLQVGRFGPPSLVESLREGQEWVEPELALPYTVARLALGDSTAEAELRRVLGSDDTEERMTALDYLVVLEGPTATDLIRKAASGSGLSARYATLALAARGEAPAVSFLEAMGDEDAEARRLAMDLAGATGALPLAERERKAIRDALRIGLSDSDATVRLDAAESVATLGLNGEEPWLKALLLDDYPAVRVEAAAALAEGSERERSP